MRMRKSQLIRFVLGVSIFVCILLNSCVNSKQLSKDIPVSDMVFGKNEVLTINAAKSWFYVDKIPVSKIEDNIFGFLVKPSWDDAKEWKKGKLEVVEAPLLSNHAVVFFDNKTLKKANLKKDTNKIKNVGRMVFLKDLKTGEISNYLMFIIGNYDYLMKKDNKISNNNYLYREPEFDGNVFFFKPDGSFVNGWKYVKGKITEKILSMNNQSPLPTKTNNFKHK